MDDYLSEKEQWEAVKSWLRENGLWIIAGIALGAVGLSGWRECRSLNRSRTMRLPR